MSNAMDKPGNPESPDRRDFLKKACAVAAGSIAVAVPAAAGVAMVLDPLKRKTEAVGKVFVTSLQALPDDGTPRRYPILASRVDAWNRFPNAAIGAVYLRRTSENTVEALNVVCPHAGCSVDYKPGTNSFYCPCHNSSFQLTGQLADKKSPSPRGMDTLEVEVRNESEVWVKFQNFKTGMSAKIPVA
jgi:menaquinol-cytochrome c reductase iron-sulfur subunit